jgi:hypothetical protein
MSVIADIAYAGRAIARPRYYANAHERDEVDIAPAPMPVGDARGMGATLDREGFALVAHESAVRDWRSREEVAQIYAAELAQLVKAQTGADEVIVSPHGILRFSEKSGLAGSSNNSHPARFAHIDVADGSARTMAERGAGGRAFARYAAINIWRALSPAPQDVPLALCDARSVDAGDLIVADAIFDEPDGREWGFEGLLVAHNRAHRWYYYPNMHEGEAILFKTKDSLEDVARHIPHVAFDDPTAPKDAPARCSIEMRATADWWA